MSKLIGTNPNQVPSNADLGTAAFMDKKEFLLSEGSSLSAIDKVIGNTVVDVVVYDTSLDWDSGVWRKRITNTSWYNEPLNTSTRGSRREFPSVAVFALEGTKLTIYDADDPNLPMWMIFHISLSPSKMIGFGVGGGNRGTSVAIKNGQLVVGVKDTTNNNAYSSIINFISEEVIQFGPATYFIGHKISDRNRVNSWAAANSGGASAAGILPAQYVYDVALTEMPNTPIDHKTGLPHMIIGFGTSGGAGFLRTDSYQMFDLKDAGNNYNSVYQLDFDGDEVILGAATWVGQGYRAFYKKDIPLLADATYNITSDRYLSSHDGTYTHKMLTGSANWKLATTKDGAAVAVSNSSLVLLAEGEDFRSKNMTAFIDSDFNTGWMPGQIMFASLCDTVKGTRSIANLVTNGTFDSDTAWTKGTDWTISGGKANIADNGRTSDSILYQDLGNLIDGDQYTVRLTWNLSVGDFDIDIGGGQKMFSIASTYGNSGTRSFTIPNGEASDIIKITANQHAVGTFDDITVHHAPVQNYHVGGNNNRGHCGVRLTGAIRKVDVAQGSELQAVTGFSSSNKMQIIESSTTAYGEDFTFGGTGDFTVSCWLRTPTPGTTQYYFTQNSGIRLTTSSDHVRFHTYDASNNVSFIDTYDDLMPNHWHHVVCLRRGGTLEMYLDGKYNVATFASHTVMRTLSAGDTFIGTDTAGGAPWLGDLCLLKVSSTAISLRQIEKIYYEEREMMMPNAKVSLYGDVRGVKAISYDKGKDTLHVGNTDGRSEFKNLCRIDSTTAGVSNAISAANGLVAED
jgi:hypothetical protein